MTTRRTMITLALSAAAALSAPLHLHAQTAWPEKPVKLIVPFPPGGGGDNMARLVMSRVAVELGQPIVFENMAGAGGNLGSDLVAKAAPDGYTIGILTVEIGMMRHAGLTQLSGADYTPLGLMNFDPNAVLVRADAPYKTAQDLLDAPLGDQQGRRPRGGRSGGLRAPGLVVDALGTVAAERQVRAPERDEPVGHAADDVEHP